MQDPPVTSFPYRIDEDLDHYRRYQRDDLTAKLTQAGFQVERLNRFNPLGAVGWFVAGKIFRARRISGMHITGHRWLFPFARFLDRRPWIRFGLSHVAIARKAP